MRTRILLPKAHSRKQQLIMDALCMPYLVELWVACGTKYGKTLAASAAGTTKTVITQQDIGRWVAPIYSQSKIGFRYMKRMLPPPPHVKADNSDLSLTLTALDTKFEFRSGKFPEDLEGEGVGIGYILDECAKMQEQVYTSARTTTTVTRAPIIPISTPRGKNWFYTRCMQAKDEMEWALAKGQIPTRLFITAPTSDNPMVAREAIEDARRSLPDRLFRQYYLAEFIDDGDVFVGYRECICTQPLLVSGAVQKWKDPEYVSGTVVVGADWAKTKDYTVFTAFDIVTRRMVGFERFHKTKYTEAIRKLVLFCRQFSDVLVVRHDKTGLGNVIDDQLAYTDLPYEGITFTNNIKAEMVAQLITSLEQKTVGLPHWNEMLDELESYEVQTTAIGNMTYGATEGKHDDIVSSMLLSHTALVQYSDTSWEVKFLEELGKKRTVIEDGKTERKDPIDPVEQFYRDLRADDDD